MHNIANMPILKIVTNGDALPMASCYAVKVHVYFRTGPLRYASDAQRYICFQT